jgi:hypothetical protein
MKKRRKTANRRKKRRTGHESGPTSPVMNAGELQNALRLQILRRLDVMLSEDRIAAFDVWAKEVAAKMNMKETVVHDLVEPAAIKTIADYFNVAGVKSLKAVFEAIAGTEGPGARAMGLQIVRNTIARLDET